MFAVSTYKEIEQIEKEKCSKHLIAVLFVRPNSRDAEEIIKDFEYLHYRTGEAFSIYAAGYTNHFDCAYKANYRKVTTCTGSDWYYGAKDFSDFVRQLTKRIKNWTYGGNIEILLFQGHESDNSGFDFRNYISLDITYGINNGYIFSFSSFLESMINHVEDAIVGTAMLLTPTGKIKVREVIEASLKDCNDTLIPIKDVMRNRHFYKIPSADNS
jgi:hypothetical protein